MTHIEYLLPSQAYFLEPDVKHDQPLHRDANTSKPFQSVRTPTAVKYGATIAFILFFAFIAFYYFGPKSSADPDADARPIGGQKAQAPLGPSSAPLSR